MTAISHGQRPTFTPAPMARPGDATGSGPWQAPTRLGAGAPTSIGVRSRSQDDRWTEVALYAALVTLVLFTGLIFTFSAAVMPNLAGADDLTFVTTLQRYNDNPVFPITFTLALVATGVAAFMQRRHGRNAGVRWTVAAFVLSAVVMVITSALHIPLNQEIDQVTNLGSAAELADVRDRVEGPWVWGNIARTLLSTAAVAALGRAIFLQGRTTADRAAGR